MLNSSSQAMPRRRSTRRTVQLFLIRERLREFFTFDAGPLGAVASWAAIGVAALLRLAGRNYDSLKLLTAAHRSAYSEAASRAIEGLLSPAMPLVVPPWRRYERRHLAEHVEITATTASFAQLREDPWKILGKRILVVKSAAEHERGVIVMDYMYTFPTFQGLFDLRAVMQRYHLVLEPSWVGCCNLDVLSYLDLDQPVFVETTEPRDVGFLRRLDRNLIPLKTAGNWWVDDRMMRPLDAVTKDIDVVMVSGWSRYKRHARVFAAVRKLRDQGRRLKMLLIGYGRGMDLTRTFLQDVASFFGIDDQIEWRENLHGDAVNLQLNRAKVHVLWSRKEGYNRAIIEAMLAGVPTILRAGHNYGYHYPYINPQTGCFADEDDLPMKLLRMVESYDEFEPRQWVLANMSCEVATEIMSRQIREFVTARGERWTRDIAVRNVFLGQMRYSRAEESSQFDADYSYLVSNCRR